jgi:hypothetical protein
VIGRLLGTGVLAGVLLASCSGFAAETGSPSKAPVENEARPAPAAAVSEEAWEGTPLKGVGARSRLWDVAVNEAGVFVAVGTVRAEDSSTAEPLVVWRSEDGISWREVFRRKDPLDTGGPSGLAPPNAVAARGRGFAFVGGDCPQRCQPVALYSPDGTSWREVEVPVRRSSLPQTAAGRTGGGAVPGQRLIFGSPGHSAPSPARSRGPSVRPGASQQTVSGAGMIDVAALGDRLVAVGWVEGGSGDYGTSHAAWISDDGGRRWRQAPEGAFGDGDDEDRQGGPMENQDELNRIVPAGDRVVAGGGNRCCADQSVSELWLSEDGKAWRAVTLPEAQSVNIDALGVRGGAVHVVGRPGGGQEGEETVHWRLAGDDTWARLPDPPGPGTVLGEPGGLALVSDWRPFEGSPGLRLFRSPDGHDFRLSQATSPTAGGVTVAASGSGSGGSVVLVVGDRLLVYARSGAENLLFESRADDG